MLEQRNDLEGRLSPQKYDDLMRPSHFHMRKVAVPSPGIAAVVTVLCTYMWQRFFINLPLIIMPRHKSPYVCGEEEPQLHCGVVIDVASAQTVAS